MMRSPMRRMPSASPWPKAWSWPILADRRSRGHSVAMSSWIFWARSVSPATQASVAAIQARSRALAPEAIALARPR